MRFLRKRQMYAKKTPIVQIFYERHPQDNLRHKIVARFNFYFTFELKKRNNATATIAVTRQCG